MKYVEPEMEILEVEQDDVIKTSGGGLGNGVDYHPNTGESDHEGWIPKN